MLLRLLLSRQPDHILDVVMSVVSVVVNQQVRGHHTERSSSYTNIPDVVYHSKNVLYTMLIDPPILLDIP